jgi:hypothetical protein
MPIRNLKTWREWMKWDRFRLRNATSANFMIDSCTNVLSPYLGADVMSEFFCLRINLQFRPLLYYRHRYPENDHRRLCHRTRSNHTCPINLSLSSWQITIGAWNEMPSFTWSTRTMRTSRLYVQSVHVDVPQETTTMHWSRRLLHKPVHQSFVFEHYISQFTVLVCIARGFTSYSV